LTTIGDTTRTPVRTKPFAPNTSIGGRERELLLAAFDSLTWSGFRAGAQDHDIRALCDMTSHEAAKFRDGEALYLGGSWTRRLEAMFAARAGVRFAIACNSATSGLVMAAGALDLRPGDEVLVPCMSFHATATALVPWGCVPVFCEVKPDTFCIDPIDAAAKITARTKAIVVVHLGGSPADMDALLPLGLPIIEDCAQSLGATYRGREVGSIGTVGVCSLTETKSITCGEGGVVLTDDVRIARKARLIRNHGEGVAQDDWTDEELHNVVGMNFRLTDLQSALAVAQYEQLGVRNRQREINAERLWSRLSKWPCFTRQAVEEHAVPAWFIFKMRYVAEPGMPSRDELADRLAEEGIPAVTGYTRLLYENPLFARRGAGYGRGTCPRAERVNDEFLWFTFLNPPNGPADMDDAADAVDKILSNAR
jgi:dTDP-4-amino-4,6-dideoxygalactose transaminase